MQPFDKGITDTKYKLIFTGVMSADTRHRRIAPRFKQLNKTDPWAKKGGA